ncbi:MAG TPA: TonB-dependent receptor [Nitrospirales bacterium]|nr:TonB-dependent receptor [Nitrospirales bacterium]
MVGRLVGLLCAGWLVSLLIPTYSGAAENPDEPVRVPETVISSTRLPDVPVDARTLPAKITVITAEDIKRTGAKTVQEALQWATGIVMYDQVGNAFQQTIDLRGFNGQPVPATSVFVDGQRINEPDFNTVNFDLIPFDTIERIEILPGSSAIYGKNALGGVINIITKRGGDKRQVTGDTLWGSFNRQRYTINSSGPIGKKVDYYANFGRETEDGYRDQSDAKISRFFGKVGFRPTERTDLTVSYTYVNDNLKQAGTLPVSIANVDPRRNFTPGDFFAHETNVFRFNGRQDLGGGFSLNANAFYRHLDQEGFNVGQTSTSDNLTKTESKGGTLQATADHRIGVFRNVLVGGGEFQRNDFKKNLTGAFGLFTFTNQNATGEDITAFYVSETLHILDRLILTGGARYDHDQLNFTDNVDPTNNGGKRYSRVTRRGGVTYLITETVSVYGNYSEGFRVPTFDELFANGPFGSNPNLRPVRTKSYEVGTRAAVSDRLEVQVALFQIDARDEIFFTCNLCDFSFGDGQNRNLDRTRRRGVETTVKVRPHDRVDVILNHTYTEARFLTSFNLGSPTTRHVNAGDTLPQVPTNRFSVTTNYRPADGWTLSLMGLYVGSQFMLNDENNAGPKVSSYFQLNSRFAYERPVPGGRLSAFVMINNMLDQRYSTHGIMAANVLTGGGAVEPFVMPAPGIAAYGGLSYRFESPI